MRFARSVLLAVVLAAAPFAAAQAEISPDPAKLESGSFTLDKGHARITASYSHFGLSNSSILFTDFDAALTLDAKAPAKSVLKVDLRMDGIDAAVPTFAAHLKSADFFDAAAYPTAGFKSTKVEVTGANTGRITGDLTLHGVTRPVVLDATFNAGGPHPMTKKYVVGFDARGTVKRSDFGLGRYAPYVGDEVTLVISAEFERQ